MIFSRTYEIHSHMLRWEDGHDDARTFNVETVSYVVYTVNFWVDPVDLVIQHRKEQEEKYPDTIFMLQSIRRV